MKIFHLDAGPLLDYWVAMAAGYDPVYQAASSHLVSQHTFTLAAAPASLCSLWVGDSYASESSTNLMSMIL